MEGLQAEWSEQHAKYEADMATLQSRLVDLQQDYEERWRTTERSARQVIESTSRQAAEARTKVQQEILRLDEEWEREAVASRELAEEQNKIMAVAREAALSEMQAQLQSRQHDIEEQVATERRRCESVRH